MIRLSMTKTAPSACFGLVWPSAFFASCSAACMNSLSRSAVIRQIQLSSNLVPGGIRTPNLLIRSQKLYPVELQALISKSQAPSSKLYRFEILELGIWNLEFTKPGGRRDSTPQQPEPQSGTLPLSYGHHHWRENKILKSESFFANKGLDFSRSFH